MSASDIEKLVPNISKACQFNTDGSRGGADAISKRKHCMELTKKNVLSKATSPPNRQTETTQNNRELKCRSGDFACMLKSKVKDYLKRAKIGGKSSKGNKSAAAGAELLLRGNRNPPAKAKVQLNNNLSSLHCEKIPNVKLIRSIHAIPRPTRSSSIN